MVYPKPVRGYNSRGAERNEAILQYITFSPALCLLRNMFHSGGRKTKPTHRGGVTPTLPPHPAHCESNIPLCSRTRTCLSNSKISSHQKLTIHDCIASRYHYLRSKHARGDFSLCRRSDGTTVWHPSPLFLYNTETKYIYKVHLPANWRPHHKRPNHRPQFPTPTGTLETSTLCIDISICVTPHLFVLSAPERAGETLPRGGRCGQLWMV